MPIEIIVVYSACQKYHTRGTVQGRKFEAGMQGGREDIMPQRFSGIIQGPIK
jgi:hypothetical protein